MAPARDKRQPNTRNNLNPLRQRSLFFLCVCASVFFCFLFARIPLGSRSSHVSRSRAPLSALTCDLHPPGVKRGPNRHAFLLRVPERVEIVGTVSEQANIWSYLRFPSPCKQLSEAVGCFAPIRTSHRFQGERSSN